MGSGGGYEREIRTLALDSMASPWESLKRWRRNWWGMGWTFVFL